MASLSERVLGKRILNYLKNEALVGRISQKKLQVKYLIQNFLYKSATS
jgi:hypothetical protein